MVEKRALPKHVLAKNLKAAMTHAKISAPQVAKIAGVDRKTITNWLNGIYDPQPELLDQVAAALGFHGWMLISPDFNPTKNVDGAQVTRLMELYNAADEKGKESILSVAEMAANYRR